MPLPTPEPPPPDAAKKDRMSVGATSSNKPLILKKDEEISVAKGQPNVAPPEPAPPAPAAPQQAKDGRGAPEVPGSEGLKLPEGLGRNVPRGQEGSRGRPGLTGPALEESIDRIGRETLQKNAQLGIPTGTGKNVGGLKFDAEGADFTAWINEFRRQVYANWNPPKAFELGIRGHVDIEFWVERDGRISDLRILKGSGTISYDRASSNALTSSHFLALPADYGPPRCRFEVTFIYNEEYQGS
jgi:TonB family protein